MSIKSNVVEEALRLADEPAQPKQAPQTPNAERAREIADALDRVMAEPREVGRPLACAAAPPPLHDETVPIREYANSCAPQDRFDEDGYNIRRYGILAAVIIAVAMMWPITNIFRSYVERPTPTIPASDPDRGQSSSEAPQTAQSAPAPLLTDAARTAAGDNLASLPDPSLKGPLTLPPGDAPPPAATPTGPAETALNAPAVASGEAAAVTDSAQLVATAETASSEAVTPVQRDRLTEIGPATRSIAPVGPVPLPRARPVDAPPPVPSSPPSSSPYGYQPGLESVH